tara:strand:- start:276 stop:470 length:195 start_codon:yes stop_codon:yes gene_type:complete
MERPNEWIINPISEIQYIDLNKVNNLNQKWENKIFYYLINVFQNKDKMNDNYMETLNYYLKNIY